MLSVAAFIATTFVPTIADGAPRRYTRSNSTQRCEAHASWPKEENAPGLAEVVTDGGRPSIPPHRVAHEKKDAVGMDPIAIWPL